MEGLQAASAAHRALGAQCVPLLQDPPRAELPHAWPASSGVETAKRLHFPSARSLDLSWLNPTSKKNKKGKESSDHFPLPALL